MNKKASAQIGIVIIAFGALLILGSFFFETTGNNDKKNDETWEYRDSFLFYINNVELGRQSRVTETFPNIELGSREIYNTIYLGNTFLLTANAFTKNSNTRTLYFEKPEYLNEVLIYFNPKRTIGKEDLIISIDGNRVLQTMALQKDSPIRVHGSNIKNNSVQITFEIEKPKWYQLWKWNKFEMHDLRIVEVKQNRANNERVFNFQIEKDSLDKVYIDLVISCEELKEVSEAIEVNVNGFIVSNSNPQCLSRHNRITAHVPTSVLNEGKNTLTLKTDGYYKVAYSINKIYFNEKDFHRFTINNFNDIYDVVIFGDFETENLDLKINSRIISIKRNEARSIISLLRVGTNELTILTKPVTIRELAIEKNERIN